MGCLQLTVHDIFLAAVIDATSISLPIYVFLYFHLNITQKCQIYSARDGRAYVFLLQLNYGFWHGFLICFGSIIILSMLSNFYTNLDTPCAAVSCVVPVCPAGQVAKVPEGESCAVCVCEIEGQTFSQCASDCPRSCDSPPGIVCGPTCRVGCKCPPNQVIDTVNKRCVPLEECPAECKSS